MNVSLTTRQEFLLNLKLTQFNTQKKQIMHGKNYTAFVNITRGFKGFYTTLLEEMNDFRNVDVEQMWIMSRPLPNVYGRGITSEKIDVFTEEPIISCSCVHVILVTSKDKNFLEYAEYIFNRYMQKYEAVSKVDEDRKIKTDSIDMVNKAKEELKRAPQHTPTRERHHKYKKAGLTMTYSCPKKKLSFWDKVIEKVIHLLINLSR